MFVSRVRDPLVDSHGSSASSRGGGAGRETRLPCRESAEPNGII